jgi:CBS domain-containing protein
MSIADALELMREKNIGSVVVVDEGTLCGIGKPCGMLTDRDVALRIVRERRDPQQTTEKEIMTTNPACISVDKTLHELTAFMRHYHVRRVPIVDLSEHVIGMVTLDDLLLLVSKEMVDLGQGISEAMVSQTTGMKEGFPFEEWRFYC